MLLTKEGKERLRSDFDMKKRGASSHLCLSDILGHENS